MDFQGFVLTRDFNFVPCSYEDHSQHNVLTEPSSSNSKSTKRAKKSTSLKVKSNKKPTVKDQRMHKFLFEKGGLEDGTRVAYRISKGKPLKGKKEDWGIRCSCCNTVISPSMFEAHANRSGRRKPYDHIFLSNGDSLHAYASKLKLTGKHMALNKDDVCDVCQEGDDLFPCSGCPRSFHAGRVHIKLYSCCHFRWSNINLSHRMYID
ncbi:uncharacterized protein LOC143607141 isoform X2 [Bidens hawaiensis]|uniref:uncharacterized protein LOC143607141 isoform X2 n=1 Tax=Bidens hawaiensis TaxID=980011 RepID=UPI004049C2F7